MLDGDEDNGGLLLTHFVKCKGCGALVLASVGEEISTCEDHQ